MPAGKVLIMKLGWKFAGVVSLTLMVPVWAVAGAAAPLQGENRKGNLPMPLNALVIPHNFLNEINMTRENRP